MNKHCNVFLHLYPLKSFHEHIYRDILRTETI